MKSIVIVIVNYDYTSRDEYLTLKDFNIYLYNTLSYLRNNRYI